MNKGLERGEGLMPVDLWTSGPDKGQHVDGVDQGRELEE